MGFQALLDRAFRLGALPRLRVQQRRHVERFRQIWILGAQQVGHALGLLFAGSFLIEKTCNIDGMGYLGFQAIVTRDYPIILGLLVFLVLIRLFGNIISDIIWALIDPRIRFGS